MKINEKFTFEEFKRIISGLNDSRIKYFVTGSWAHDAINNEYNEHGDLDLVMFHDSKEKIINFFKEKGYKIYEFGNKYILEKGELKIEIRFIYDKKDYFEIRSNLCLDKISKESFERKNVWKINRFEFRVIPNEQLVLYEDGHLKKDRVKNERVNKAVRKVKPLCKEIKIMEQVVLSRGNNLEMVEL